MTCMKGSQPRPSIVRFGVFELDQQAGELRREGTKIRLQEQPLQVLQMLLEEPGRVTTREELRHRIWPADTFVDFDHGINNAIKRLREALGDSAEHPRLVETLPKRGYRFIAPVNRGLEPHLLSCDKPGDSIAVFPLANANANPEMEYLAAGVPESIMHC